MPKEKRFWIGLSLLNLCLVALFGSLMRSKLLFAIPFLDYRNLLSAHSHFAFSGWAGLALITLLVYDVLPAEKAQKKSYQRILWGLEITSLGMAFTFPFTGYNLLSIFFSSAYIFVTFFFGWRFFNDLKSRPSLPPVVRLLSVGAVASLIISSVGPAALSYILITKSGTSLLYRDSVYTFLHFQYNGFFTLSVFAVFFSRWVRKGVVLPASATPFSRVLVASVVPALFLALLWHNLTVFYVLAAIGCVCILTSVAYFFPVLRSAVTNGAVKQPLANVLLIAAFVSFALKMLLTVGTLYPPLGRAVYGARPVIIGFLHLVFLAFVSFFLFSTFLQDKYFTRATKTVAFPFYLFGAGVLLNEIFLMVQGLGILFKTNSNVYNWLLWGAAILLFVGALSLAAAFYGNQRALEKRPL